MKGMCTFFSCAICLFYGRFCMVLLVVSVTVFDKMEASKYKGVREMRLGNRLFHARKKCGLSQEAVAERLGVSRQTISKWETDETLPDIYQSKKMAKLYGMSLDELIAFDVEMDEIQEIIEKSDDTLTDKVDWSSAWGKKYPVLVQYHEVVNVPNFACRLRGMLDELQEEYGYNEMDAFLVLKDILYQVWKARKRKP